MPDTFCSSFKQNVTLHAIIFCRLSVGRGTTGGGTGTSTAGSGRLLRVLTATCLILSAVFYLLLLAVPSTERHPVCTFI